MKMTRLLIAMLLVVSASVSQAADLPVLIVTESGYRWMIADANGMPVLYEFSQVIVLGKPSGKPGPGPVPDAEVTKQVRDWVIDLKPEAMADLAAVKAAFLQTQEMTEGVDPKLTTIGEVEGVLSALLQQSITNKAAWGVFAGKVDALCVSLQKSGRIKTAADYGKVIAEIARALP